MNLLQSGRKIGVLISNVGTPDAPTPDAIKKYLAQFLSDPQVVRIPKLIWWLILKSIVLPTRPKKSAKLYQKIWTPAGSPLLTISAELVDKLQRFMDKKGAPFHFALGMRYGNPSLKQALLTLKKRKVDTVILWPLYPQYSTTTTKSTYLETKKQLQAMNWSPALHLIAAYGADPSYIEAITQSIQLHWRKHPPGQKLLFSFHGIPEKYVKMGDPYLAQCLETSRQIASQLNLADGQWETVFQSRLGRARWLQPYCIQTLQVLPSQAMGHIDIICPGFTVDCLETLEEIAITNKEIFYQAGGTIYHYIPALNATDLHVEALSKILLQFVDKIK